MYMPLFSPHPSLSHVLPCIPLCSPVFSQVLVPHREDVKIEGISVSKDFLALFERKEGLQVCTTGVYTHMQWYTTTHTHIHTSKLQPHTHTHTHTHALVYNHTHT